MTQPRSDRDTRTPETRCWPLGGALVTAVTGAGETAITLTVTTPSSVIDARAALVALSAAITDAAARRRREEVSQWTS